MPSILQNLWFSDEMFSFDTLPLCANPKRFLGEFVDFSSFVSMDVGFCGEKRTCFILKVRARVMSLFYRSFFVWLILFSHFENALFRGSRKESVLQSNINQVYLPE